LLPASCSLTPGWLAGLLIALHPAQIYMVTHIQVAPWAALMLTLLVAMALSPRWQSQWWGAMSIGLVGGVALLTEPIFALALPVLAVAFAAPSPGLNLFALLRLRDFAAFRAIGRSAVLAAGCSAIIAPWLWRNYRVHGEFVFIKSTFGYAFWQGNNAASWGTDKIPKPGVSQRLQGDGRSPAALHRAACAARHETLYIDDVLLKPGRYREFAGLTEPQRCRLLGCRAIDFVSAQPAAYASLCLSRLRYFLLWDETNPKSHSWIYRLTSGSWLALSILGLWSTRAIWRRLWPLCGVCLVIVLFHVLTITSARFRLPLEPLTSVWVAGAVAAGMAWLRGRMRRLWLAGSGRSE
jgi:hypothetical protein